MKLLTILLSLMMLGLFTSCAVEPVPIQYGQDACHFCQMNIVDRQHSAEIVTKKGKAFKYDAIECMLQDRKNWEETAIAFYLIADYTASGELIDARTSTYLISENIPSPMGANLSGFGSKEATEQLQQEHGGEILTWVELKKKIQ